MCQPPAVKWRASGRPLGRAGRAFCARNTQPFFMRASARSPKRVQLTNQTNLPPPRTQPDEKSNAPDGADGNASATFALANWLPATPLEREQKSTGSPRRKRSGAGRGSSSNSAVGQQTPTAKRRPLTGEATCASSRARRRPATMAPASCRPSGSPPPPHRRRPRLGQPKACCCCPP